MLAQCPFLIEQSKQHNSKPTSILVTNRGWHSAGSVWPPGANAACLPLLAVFACYYFVCGVTRVMFPTKAARRLVLLHRY